MDSCTEASTSDQGTESTSETHLLELVVNKLRFAVLEASTSDQGRFSSESTSEAHRLADAAMEPSLQSTPASVCEGEPSMPSTPITRRVADPAMERILQPTPATHTPAVCEGEPSMPSRRDAELEASSPVAAISRGGSTPDNNGPPEGEAADILDEVNILYSTPGRARSRGRSSSTSELKKRKTPGKPRRGTSSRKSRKSSRNGKERAVSDCDPDADWIDEPDVCAFCDDGVGEGDELLCCDGGCMRSFHATAHAGRYNKCGTLGLTVSALSELATWVCPNCEAGQHQCFACGKLGNSRPSTEDVSQQVFECASTQCKRVYHPACVAKLLLIPEHLETVEEKLTFRKRPFLCPLHKCASCNGKENKADPDLCLVKCRRCPKAWHAQCLPDVCRSQLWAAGSKHVMYCGRHTLDPELQTPKRDHIKFPPTNRTPYQHTVYNITSDSSCSRVTIESIKKSMGIFFDA